ncbi:MAG: tetratricopeptide repeat protein, partial [Anaerolineae bacterium]|nr:tetratricopeptide repeat protein [Anaerolineae bacterium]
ASLHHLRTLLNRSFITVSDSRYGIHELLRQFADAELAKNPDMQRRIRDLHCDCYAMFLQERLEIMYRGHKQRVMNELTLDLDNLRAAWAWAVDHLKLDALYQSARTLSSFWHTQGRYLEGIELLENAVRALQQGAESGSLRDELIAIMSTDLGWYYIRLGRLDESEMLFKRAHDGFERLGFPPLVSTTAPLVGLAFVASIRGSYEQATKIAEEALRLCQARQDFPNQAYAFYALTGIKLAQGEYEQARQYGEQAVEMSRRAEDQWVEAYCLIELGNVARAVGDNETARRHYQASFTIREAFEDPEGMAAALNNLGSLALRRRDYAEAQRLYRQSQRLYQEIHDQGGLATALHGLGQI